MMSRVRCRENAESSCRVVDMLRDNVERYQYLSSVYQKYLVIKNNDNYVDSSLKLDAPSAYNNRSEAPLVWD